MAILLELILIAVLLALFLRHQAVRHWLSQSGRADVRAAGVIVAVFLALHVVDMSRYTFPFVRWSMYSEIFEPDEMAWGKIQARLEDGTTVPINPTRQFPSISRNFGERFRDLVLAAENGELTPLGEDVYKELLTAIGRKYNRAHPGNPATEISAFIQSIHYENGRSRVVDREISVIEL